MKRQMGQELPASLPTAERMVALPRSRQVFIAQMILTGGDRKASYYAAGGQGENWRVIASNWCNEPDVAAALSAAVVDEFGKFTITADRVLREIALVAFSDIDHFRIGEDGELEVRDDYSPSVTRAISGLEVERDTYTDEAGQLHVKTKTKVKLWSKPEGLNMLMKYLGMIIDRKVKVKFDGDKLPLDIAREAIAAAFHPRTGANLPIQLRNSPVPEEGEEVFPPEGDLSQLELL